ADEPTGNLDSNSTKEILQILRELHGEGRTVILITHDNEIAEQADRVIKIRDGKIVSDMRQNRPQLLEQGNMEDEKNE
ncbi:MAG TPA: macrolide ABC transporter ATP-binding protein, partial [Lachnospiraceae bacterium]|nr:macrolide ABC transporter ATP-binding protein [Lachnospiraceae bacterium]